MSVARGLAQPLTRNLVTVGTTVLFNGADLLSRFTTANGNQVIGSLVVAPTISVLTAAVNAADASNTIAAGRTLIDVGKTITLTVADGANNNASIKMREVKFQNNINATSVQFVTGYVVVENNFNAGIVNNSELYVTVARV
jgi:hypothetical protein